MQGGFEVVGTAELKVVTAAEKAAAQQARDAAAAQSDREQR
jgi:hypothetical protein